MRNRRLRLTVIAIGATSLVTLGAYLAPTRILVASGCALTDAPVTNMRTLVSALITYENMYHTYPSSLAALGPPLPGQPLSPERTGFIDPRLAFGVKVGYVFHYVPKKDTESRSIDGYTLTADPIDNARGGHHYFADDSGVVRSEESRPATVTSPPTQDTGCICFKKFWDPTDLFRVSMLN